MANDDEIKTNSFFRVIGLQAPVPKLGTNFQVVEVAQWGLLGFCLGTINQQWLIRLDLKSVERTSSIHNYLFLYYFFNLKNRISSFRTNGSCCKDWGKGFKKSIYVVKYFLS